MNIYIGSLNLSLGNEQKRAYTPSTKENHTDGVYIYTESGNLWLPQYWGLSGEKPYAIALIKGETKILVSLLKGSDSGIELLPSGVKVALEEYSSIDSAMKDRDREKNTDKLCEAGSEAALFCRKQGSSWHLPTLFDMNTLFESKNEIDAALTIAGGDPLYCGWHWTSTRYSNSRNWIFDWIGGSRYFYSQDHGSRVRPVSAFL